MAKMNSFMPASHALAALLLGGCSFTDPFNDNTALNAHLDSSVPNTMTIQQATSAMERIGFSCTAFPDEIMPFGAPAYSNEVLCKKTTQGGILSPCQSDKQVQILDWEKRICRYAKHSQDCREARNTIRAMNIGGTTVCGA